MVFVIIIVTIIIVVTSILIIHDVLFDLFDHFMIDTGVILSKTEQIFNNFHLHLFHHGSDFHVNAFTHFHIGFSHVWLVHTSSATKVMRTLGTIS